jgi:hypothetical protein
VASFYWSLFNPTLAKRRAAVREATLGRILEEGVALGDFLTDIVAGMGSNLSNHDSCDNGS